MHNTINTQAKTSLTKLNANNHNKHKHKQQSNTNYNQNKTIKKQQAIKSNQQATTPTENTKRPIPVSKSNS